MPLHAFPAELLLTPCAKVGYIFSLAVYLTVSVPAVRTVVNPVEGDTRDDQIEAMRVLAAGNTIIIVLLAGILLLQVSLANPA